MGYAMFVASFWPLPRARPAGGGPDSSGRRIYRSTKLEATNIDDQACPISTNSISNPTMTCGGSHVGGLAMRKANSHAWWKPSGA